MAELKIIALQVTLKLAVVSCEQAIYLARDATRIVEMRLKHEALT